MQKHVNFEPRNCIRSPSRMRHCLAGVPSATRRATEVTLLEQAPCRPRAAVSHVRQPPAARPPRCATTPVHFLSSPPRYNQVIHTYPSLVEAIKMKTAEMEEEYDQFEKPERLKLPSEPCACRRCASRTLSPARQSNASLRQSNASLRQSNASLRHFRDNIMQFSERGTMTANTNDVVCEAQGPKTPPSLHRVVNVQRSEISSIRRSPSNSSSADRSPTGSILKRPSHVTGLNFIKYQEQEPERDLHEAESFPQAQQEYFEEGYLNGYLDPKYMYPIEKVPEYPCVPYGLGPASINVGRERQCKCCTPQLDKGGIPYSHRYSGRYHKHCAQPCMEEFGFYKTTMLGKPPPQPWYPVTKGSNVFFKPKQDGIRRPRRVLSSERNIEMYIDKEDVELMVRRNRYY